MLYVGRGRLLLVQWLLCVRACCAGGHVLSGAPTLPLICWRDAGGAAAGAAGAGVGGGKDAGEKKEEAGAAGVGEGGERGEREAP